MLLLAALPASPVAAVSQDPLFTPSGISETGVTLTLAHHTGDWHYKQITPSEGPCTPVTNSVYEVEIDGLEVGTEYDYGAYNNQNCLDINELADTTFTTLDFHLSDKGRTEATLTLEHYAAGQEWWYQQSHPAKGTCTSAGTGTSVDVTGLTKNTSYTYHAYDASDCASSRWLGVEYFKTLPAHVLQASDIKQTEAKLTLVNANILWSHKQTTGPGTGTCADVAKGTTDATVTGLTANSDYTFTAYRDGGCDANKLIDWVDFKTLPVPPAKPPTLSATARIEGAALSWTSGGALITGWQYQVETGSTWGAWKNIPDSDANTTSYTVPNLTGGTSYNFKVRAVNRGGDGTESDESGSVTVLVKPDVDLSLSVSTLAESASETTVTVTAEFSNDNTFVSDKTVTVTLGGTATSGTDYDTVSDFDITISANSSSGTATFALDPTDDAVVEGDETIQVSGTSTGLTVNSASLTLTDNDNATVTVNDADGDEGDDLTFTVTLSHAVQGGLTVTPSQTNGTAASSDYTANTSALTFDGTANETKTFTVSTTEDAVVEADETFTVGLAVSKAPSGITSTDTGTGTIDNDDAAAVTVNDASADEGESMTFTVTLSAAVQGGLTVTPSYTNGTAASGDYTANTTALSFTGTADETETFTVSTTEDAVVEGNETFTVGLTVSDAPSGITSTDTGTGTINNDDSQDAAVTVNDASASEGESMTFTVTLSHAVQGGLTVTPSYTNGTAASSDYTANTTALTFTGTANETKTFTVSTTEDAVVEANETFTVGLSVSDAPSGITSTDTGTGTISNDDNAAVTVNDASASEGASMTFTVTLSAAVQGGLTVTPSYTNGTAASTDYTTNTTALTFSGTANETKTFTVSTKEDAVVEGNETFTVGLTVSGTSLTVTSTDTGTGTITNDDNAAVTVNNASADEGDAMTFTVTLSAAVQGGLKVTPSYTNGTAASTDYTANTTALTFSGTANETKTFTVSTKEDAVVEGDETFTVGLSVSDAPSGITSTDTGTGTIEDDDGANATVRVDDASASEGNAITFKVRLSKAVQGGLQVTPSYTNGTAASTDYTANTAALSFSGTANETKTFTVSTTEDAVVEANETFTIGLTVSGTSHSITATDTGIGTINNDDNAAVTVNDANADEGDDMTFTVTLDKAVQGGLTVTPSQTNGTTASGDYTANSTGLTFTGTANETKTFTVSTAQDAVVEANETFTVRLAVSNAPSGVTATDTGRGTINNDDNATVTVNDAEADEGDGMTFTVTLDNAVQGGLTVTPSYTNGTAGGGDYTANTTALTFAGTANETETFTVSTTEDAVVEGDETFTVGLAVSNAPSGITATDTGTGTIKNDDATPDVRLSVSPASVSEGASATTITVTAQLSGNNTFATDRTVTVSVGGGTATAGTDYATVSSFDITIAAGQASGTGTFTLTPTRDNVVEGNETIIVSGTATGLTVESHPITLTDDSNAVGEKLVLAIDEPSRRLAEGASATVTVTAALSKGSIASVDRTVNVTVGGGTATPGTDYEAVPDFVITIPAGQASGTGTFELTLLQDESEEGDETIEVTGVLGDMPIALVTLVIADDDEDDVPEEPLAVKLGVRPSSVDENASATTVTVTAALVDGGAFPAAQKLTVSVGGGTATPGRDYAPVTDMVLSIAAGQTEATTTFTLTPVDDGVVEGTERIAIRGIGTGLTVTGTTLRLMDDDTLPDVELSVDPARVDEAAPPTTVTVTAAFAGDATLLDDRTIRVSVGDGTATPTADYDPAGDIEVTIAAGRTSGTATFRLTPKDDSVVEGDETIVVSGVAEGLVVHGATITVGDNDEVPEVELTVDPVTVDEGASATTVTVTASFSNGSTFPEDRPVAVSLDAGTAIPGVSQAAPGTDYAAVPDFQVVVGAGRTSGTATFTLTPKDDSMVEGDETISVSGAASGLMVHGTTITVGDNDEIPEVELTVDPVSVDEGAAATTVTVTATFSNGSTFLDDRLVTVSLDAGVATPGADHATPGTDYTAVSDFQVVVGAGRTSGTATFTLTPTDDSVVEGDETIAVSGAADGLTVHGTAITVSDDDEIPEVALDVDPAMVIEGARATTVTVTASFSNGSTFLDDRPVTVSLDAGAAAPGADHATPGTDYAAVSDFQVVVAAGRTSGTATFTLTPTDDSVVEGDETIAVTGAAEGLTVHGTAITLGDDDEIPEVNLSVDPQQVDEAASTAIVTVTASFSNGSTFPGDRTVTVSLDAGTAIPGADPATPGTDYAAVSDFQVVVGAGRTSGTATFTLTPKDDSMVEGDETISVSGAASGLVVHGTTITVGDNDEIPEVELAVDPVSVDEGAAATTVTVTATFSNGSTFPADRPVTVSLDAATAIPGADYATPGTDYTAVSDFQVVVGAGRTSGTATFTLTPTDDSVVEGDETIAVSGAADGLTVHGTAITVSDDDEIPEVALDVDPAMVIEGAKATTVTVTASFSNGSTFLDDRPVTVSLDAGAAAPGADHATPGTDYAAVSDFQVVVAAGLTSGTATFTLTPKDDSVVEGDETIAVTGAADGLTVHGTAITLGDDDEIPEVNLSVDPQQVDEAASTAIVTVTASFSNGSTFPDDRTVTVRVGGGTANPGTDHFLVPDFAVTIPAGGASGTAVFTLMPMNDGVVEDDETIQVSGVSEGLTVHDAMLMLLDDDLEERERALKYGLAGIGRTIATQAVDAIGARFDAASRLSNVSRFSNVSQPATSDGRFALDPFAVAAILQAGGLVDGRVGLPGPDAHVPGMAGSALDASAIGGPTMAGSGLGGSALGGSAFNGLAGRRMAHPTANGLVSMALTGGQNGTGGWTLWASGARTDFSGRPGGFSVEGSMGAAFLGVDRSIGSSGVLGVAVSRNQGGVDLDDEGPWAGRVDARLTTVYPYARWSPTPGLDLWGIVGLGQGDVDLDDPGGDFRTDGRLRMAATGLRGDLGRLGAVDLAVRADAFTVGMEAEGVAGSFEAADGRAQRTRLMLDASTDWRLSSSSRLTPSAEVGARVDGGDLETGPGMEVGGGLAYVNSRLGLDIAARGRWLAMHRDKHFGEWGGNLSIRRIPSDPNRGLSLSVEPAWGEDASGIMALWEGRNLRSGDFGFGLVPEAAEEAWQPDRLDMEVSYGAEVFDGLGSLKPFGQLRMMGAGSRHLRLGTGFELTGADDKGPARLRLELVGEQRARAGGAPSYGAIVGIGGPGLRTAGAVLAPFGEFSYEGAMGRRLRFGTSLRPVAGDLLPGRLNIELLGEAYQRAREGTSYGLVLRAGRAIG